MNTFAKLHSDLVWNDVYLDFLKIFPQKAQQEQDQSSSDVSVPDQKVGFEPRFKNKSVSCCQLLDCTLTAGLLIWIIIAYLTQWVDSRRNEEFQIIIVWQHTPVHEVTECKHGLDADQHFIVWLLLTQAEEILVSQSVLI